MQIGDVLASGEKHDGRAPDYDDWKMCIRDSPITSLPCNELKFKCPIAKKKAYTVQERSALLAHLKKQEPDAYTLAIMLAFYGIFRIGEIKALEWDDTDNKTVTIRQQLVEERALKEDMTLSLSLIHISSI